MSVQAPSDQVRVAPFRDADRAAWDAFVATRPEASFFHLIGWRGVIERGLGHRTHYLIAWQGDRVVGVLPLAQVKSRLFGHRLVSLPGGVYGGVVAAGDAAATALTDAACRLAESLGVDALELRDQQPAGSDWPTKDLYVTFRRAISADEEANLKAIPRKQRAMVRKGIEAGLVTELTDDVPRFFRIYAESVRNLGTPVFPLRYFRALAAAFPQAIEIAIVRHGDQDIAAVMSFFFRDEVLPYYGGSRPAARDLKGNDFMYWDLMCRAARRGVRIFDFGRSKAGTGAYSFKKNWGFTPQPLHYRFYLVGSDKMPDLNPNNPKYQYFIAAWKRLPLPLANAFGPLLARHLG